VSDGALPGDAANRQQSPGELPRATSSRNVGQRWRFMMRCNILGASWRSGADVERQPKARPIEGNKRMANPWLKKNPLMSMWFSAANAAARTRRKSRFGRGKQTTGCAYETNHTILDRRLAGCGQAAASPLKGRFVMFGRSGFCGSTTAT